MTFHFEMFKKQHNIILQKCQNKEDFPMSLGCLMLYELYVYEVLSLVDRSARVRSFMPEVVSYMQ